MQIEYRIITRPWGIECQYHAEVEGADPIVGALAISSVHDDPLPLITANVEVQLAQLTESVQQEDAVQQLSTIDTALSESKDRLKWQCITYIKGHPGAPASEWLGTLAWPDAGIAQALIYAYAESAANIGMVSLADNTIESCWLALRYLATTMSDDELRSIL